MERTAKVAITKLSALSAIAMMLGGLRTVPGFPSRPSAPICPKGKITPTTPRSSKRGVICGPATNWPSNTGPSKRDKHRAEVASRKTPAPSAKFERQRKRRPHNHPLRDDEGAFTLTGARDPRLPFGRRIWLAGISSQRG